VEVTAPDTGSGDPGLGVADPPRRADEGPDRAEPLTDERGWPVARVRLSHHWKDRRSGKNYLPGDIAEVSPELADSLHSAGYAVRADQDEDDAAGRSFATGTQVADKTHPAAPPQAGAPDAGAGPQ
jgi:hypothetical protein